MKRPAKKCPYFEEVVSAERRVDEALQRLKEVLTTKQKHETIIPINKEVKV